MNKPHFGPERVTKTAVYRPTTPAITQDFLKHLLQNYDDLPYPRLAADKAVVELLKSLGYGAIADTFYAIKSRSTSRNKD